MYSRKFDKTIDCDARLAVEVFKHPFLELGKKYLLKVAGDKRSVEHNTVIATIIQEYKRFYIAHTTKGYDISLEKNSLECGDITYERYYG